MTSTGARASKRAFGQMLDINLLGLGFLVA